ncbi:MAG: hypothetical protein WA139_03495 [Candidatus Aenigmatarchaeota archaeon]
MKVFIVGDDGPEHNSIRSVHNTYEGALKEWNKIRMELLEKAKRYLKSDKFDKEMWQKMVKSLECEDPKKIDNYPHDTPYIREWEVKE